MIKQISKELRVITMRSKGRAGGSIREFLEYYLLVILNEESSTKQKMVELIKERSSDNNDFRPGSALLVADQEVESAVNLLKGRDYIKSLDGNTLEITDNGKVALEEIDKLKEQTSESKEEATKKLISLLTSSSDGKTYVLDVGTGEGYLAFKIAEAGFKVLGIDSCSLDYSEDSIQRAEEKIDDAKKYNLEFRTANVKELQGFQNSFDYVVSNQSVHCMKDREGCIKSTYSLLKRGGKLICSDLKVGLLGFLHHGFHSFLALSQEEWLEMLPRCGYTNVKIHDVNDFCVVEAQKPFV